MASIRTIREAIAAQITDDLGVESYGGYVPEAPVLPCVSVVLSGIEYHGAHANGYTPLEIVVTIVVNDFDPLGAQQQLDAYLEETGSGSLIASVESVTRADWDIRAVSGGDIRRLEFGADSSGLAADVTFMVVR